MSMCTEREEVVTIMDHKLVLLGDTKSGKTSISTRYVGYPFKAVVESTIGAAFLVKDVHVDSTLQINFGIWDTSGQPRLYPLAPMYYRGAAAVIIVYDITKKDTFKIAQDRVVDVQYQDTPNIIIAFVGNKLDLELEREISTEEGMAFAKSKGLLFFEVSAKN